MAESPNLRQQTEDLIDTATDVLGLPTQPRIGRFAQSFVGENAHLVMSSLFRQPAGQELRIVATSGRDRLITSFTSLGLETGLSEEGTAHFIKHDYVGEPNVNTQGPEALNPIRTFLESLKDDISQQRLVPSPKRDELV